MGVVGLLIDQLTIKEVPVNPFENREFLEEVLGDLDAARRKEGPDLVLLAGSAAGLSDDITFVIELLGDPGVSISTNVGMPAIFEGEEIELAEIFAGGHGGNLDRLV